MGCTCNPVSGEDGDGRGQEKSMLSGAGAANRAYAPVANHGQCWRVQDPFYLWGERGKASWFPQQQNALLLAAPYSPVRDESRMAKTYRAWFTPAR